LLSGCLALLVTLWCRPLLAQSCAGDEAGITSVQQEGAQSDDKNEPSPTIFHHPEDTRWWISGQANVIFQAHPSFHAPYSGPNSLDPNHETATSSVLTLYTGYEITKSLEFLFDVEAVQGGGLSDALGLAGFTNLDVVRNPTLGPAPYIARAVLHKVFALSAEEDKTERSPTTSILTKIPKRRFELRGGKLSTADYFDVNAAGSDSHLQFMNWVADNNGSYDYAADTRGYTFGVIAEYQSPAWGIRFGEMLMPKVANGPDLDLNLARARSENIELELRPGERTTLRFLSYVNHANMGRYSEAIQAFLNGTDPQPDITAHRKQGRIKYGFGFNFLRELSDAVRLFGRVGWNEGQNESFAYTEVNQSVELGGDWKLPLSHLPGKLGLAFMTHGISGAHKLYLALGGNGFLLGDGRLSRLPPVVGSAPGSPAAPASSYAREDIVESYYTLQVWRGTYVGPVLQYVVHPGYNKDRGPVWVPAVRLHLEF
jgi:high affinity Mn2+ porin